MINDLRNIVLSILNKENRGEISPVDFNNLVYKAQLERFNSYLVEYRASVFKSNRGQASAGLADVSQKIRQLVSVFGSNKTVTKPVPGATYFLIPEDCAFIEKVRYNTTEVDEIERDRWVNILGSSKMKPSVEFPVYCQTGNQLNVLPTSLTAINVFYIRFPKRPKWTYQIAGGNPIFNPSAADFQDIELHESEMPELVYSICTDLNINLKNYQDFSAIESLKDKNFQKENIV